jgi:radical SAM superfamily enzyme YgiQ (UPF0313 family)
MPTTLYLVKPHPPKQIMERACPLPELYRYDWEPIALKHMGRSLIDTFGDRITLRLWHLMDEQDDDRFLSAVAAEQPDIVAFTEIDILVNEVNRLAGTIKELHPDIWTVVGGKQSSLLRAGDQFPFTAIDYAIRGDGATPLAALIRAKEAGTELVDMDGLIRVATDRSVTGPNSFSPRPDLRDLDGILLRSVPIEHHPLNEYIEKRQPYPGIHPQEPKTASLFIGSGCSYACYVCQSPIEYGDTSSKVMLRDPCSVAQEIAWLRKHHGVNNVFSLEPNLNLRHLLEVYRILEDQGVDMPAVSGFIRAGDIVRAHLQGILAPLASKGMRVLSIGLDLPIDTGRDIYHKAFTHGEMMDCIKICGDLGILVLATVIGNPDMNRSCFAEQLDLIGDLPVADVDIRLAIALRNTAYYAAVEKNLILHPARDAVYFDRQNYRYQTIQFPGKITPTETYDLVHCFYEGYLKRTAHAAYVTAMVRDHPDTAPFFDRQYRKRTATGESTPFEIREAPADASD